MCVLSSSSMLGAQRLVVVLDPCDGGFAEETVLVVHQMLIDAGSKQTEGYRGRQMR